jgi:hypothetical protein
VWDPHTQANINKVESIQRRAARFVTNNYDPRASVTTLLQDLNWPTLQHRRQLAKLIMMYRITYHNDICQVLSQFCRASMSSWSLVVSASVLMGLYRRQSSANSLALDETQGGMSFM